MDMWVVCNGDAYAITDGVETEDGFRLTDGTMLWGEDYGYEWIFVESHDADDAIAQAELFDNRTHRAQVEMEMFGASYRAGQRILQSSDDTA